MTTTRNSLTMGATGQISYREKWEGTGGSPTPIYGGSAGGNRLWYQYNHLGTVVGLSDGAGQHVASVETDAFGNPLASAATGVWATSLAERGLTTKELDGTSGMYYFYQRWYDPQTATFASRAPYPPMMEHPYGYGLNNPVVYGDPDGRRVIKCRDDGGWGHEHIFYRDPDDQWWRIELNNGGGGAGGSSSPSSGGSSNNAPGNVSIAKWSEKDVMDLLESGTLKTADVIYMTPEEEAEMFDWANERLDKRDYPYIFPVQQCRTFVDDAINRTPWGSEESRKKHGPIMCFTGDVVVHTKDGPVPIFEIREGEIVITIVDGERTTGLVTSVHSTQVFEIFHLFVGNDRITATGYHPIHIEGRGWTEVMDVLAGDSVLSIDGELITVTKVQGPIKEAASVYNISVIPGRTYFVGENGILVHNK